MKSKKEPYSGKSDSDFNADIENQYKNYKAGIYDKLKNKTVMTDKELKLIFDKWLVDNTDLVKSLTIDELYDTPEHEELVQSVNGGTEDEEGFVNGWTDDKDELFYKRLKRSKRLAKSK
jgi:hypothetical protein